MGKVDHDAAELLRDQGVAALAFAQARALECLYYCDEPGQAYWYLTAPSRQVLCRYSTA